MGEMNIKDGFCILTMILSIAFGPPENRQFWFRSSLVQLYGEILVFKESDIAYYIAKNTASEKMKVVEEGEREILTRSLEEEQFFRSDDIETVYPQTYALIVRKGEAAPAKERLVQCGNRQPIRPRSLVIQTEGEVNMTFMWILILLFFTVILTYLVNDYAWECNSLSPSKAEEDQWS